MYNKEIDKKWQQKWEIEKSFKALDDKSKKKFYSLIEFPYPSGVGLHVGHVRAFMGMEVISRKKRLEGYNVMFPIGWDAFGLPTENYAIKTGIHPRKVTDDNIAAFAKQLKALGLSFDFDRQVDTTSPEYYKWTQWIFLKLFENGLAYKDKTEVNYCTNCQVVLANEESQGGKCDRCDGEVIQMEKEVWMIKITEYADKLLEELEHLDFLPRIKVMQENWIGKSTGAEMSFKIAGKDDALEIYTTRPDTIFGVTFMVIAPEHPILEKYKNEIENYSEVVEYAKNAKKKTEFERVQLAKEKTGVEVKGISIINPLTNEKIPLWISDYVMMGYGTGAIMAVPAHDKRDYEFAKKFDIDIKQVIAMDYHDKTNPPVEGKENTNRNGVIVVVKHWEEEKYICLKWKTQTWRDLITGGIEDGETPIETAIREVKEETGYQDIKRIDYIPFEHIDHFYAAHKGVNRVVKQKNIFVELGSGEYIERSEKEKELFDILWLTKEEMFEIINLDNHKYIFDTYLKDGQPWTEEGIMINSEFLNGLNIKEATSKINEYLVENKLGKLKTNYYMKDWAFARQRYWGEPVPIVKCDKCGLVAVPEKDLPLTLPEVDDFRPSEDGQSPLAKVDSWVNTTCPKCSGMAKRETDTMPQWAGSSWYYLRYTDPKNNEELASKENLNYWLPVDWYNGGMEHVTRHLIYSRFWHRFLYDIGVVPTKEPYAKRTAQGLILGSDGEKMSKSKGNVVNPDDIINKYGADTLRTYILFIGEYELPAPWNDNGVKGAKKFLDRVVRMDQFIVEESNYDKEIIRELHKTIKKVTGDYDAMKFNTAIAQMMIFVNLVYKKGKISKQDLSKFITILSPVAPHVAEELWEEYGDTESLKTAKWPEYDEKLIKEDTVEMAVQINGQVKYKILVGTDSSKEEIERLAISDKNYILAVGNRETVKIIVVPGRLVNIVVK